MTAHTELFLQKFPAQSGATAHAVLMLHGFPSYSGKNEVIALRIATQSNTDVFVLHYRGLGKSGGTFSFTEVIEDSTEVAISLLQKGYGSLTLVGHSFGGAVALSVAQRVQGVGTLVLLSPLTRLPALAEQRSDLSGFVAYEETLGHHYELDGLAANAGRFMQAYDPKGLADDVRARGAKLIVIQAQDDEVISAFDTRNWSSSLAERPEYIEIEDDHWFNSSRERVADLIVDRLRDRKELGT